VEWEPVDGRLFEVTIRILAQNASGVLAKVATAIAEAECNVLNVTMDHEVSPYIALYFTVQVGDRMHLARLIRAVRRTPEVMRIGRVRGDGRAS
jgi:GTP diphosphokinase / guanosine-3',5'-bis(diphosphate) 3'-diphosphatase